MSFKIFECKISASTFSNLQDNNCHPSLWKNGKFSNAKCVVASFSGLFPRKFQRSSYCAFDSTGPWSGKYAKYLAGIIVKWLAFISSDSTVLLSRWWIIIIHFYFSFTVDAWHSAAVTVFRLNIYLPQSLWTSKWFSFKMSHYYFKNRREET